MRVSMGVLPTSLTKKSCSITEAETVRREGSLRRSFPNLVGWLGYWRHRSQLRLSTAADPCNYTMRGADLAFPWLFMASMHGKNLL